MKICYLILAHNNFKHLDKLIESLSDIDSSFFVHLDKKVIEKYSPVSKQTFVIPQRHDINWGGFSMIEATLDLMKFATSKVPDADYFILISGVDYPIRSKSFLLSLLNKGKEYIDIAPVPQPHKPIERYEHYFFDFDRRNLKHYNPKFLLEVLIKKLGIKRKAPFPVFAGTQWFGLTRKCTEYILETVERDSKYIEFFRHTLVPDEAFFQTIIGNSPFYQNTASSLTYTDWEVPVPPATIDDRHVDFLKNHIEFNDEYGKRFPFFARKFNDDSSPIIEKIQRELWTDID